MKTLSIVLLSLPLALMAGQNERDYRQKPTVPGKNSQEKPVAQTKKVQKEKKIEEAPARSENTWNGARLPIHMEGPFAGVEFLWWKATENGLDYALKKDFAVFQNNTFSASPIDGLAGKMKNATFDWAPGFRVDAGWRTPHDALEVFGEYTWFRTLGNKQVSHAPTDGVQPALAGTFPEYVDSTGSFLINRASSTTSLRYRLADIGLARRIEISKYLLARLFATARGGWIRRNWDVKYVCLQNNQSSRHESDWSYKGYGVQFGVATDWFAWWGFNPFVQASFSSLYGEHHNHIKSKSTLDSNRPLQRSPMDDKRGVTGTQLKTGLAWGHAWSDWSIKVFGAWETNSWYNLAEHYRVPIPVTGSGINTEKVRNLTSSTLTIQGLTLGVDVNY